MKYYIFTLIVGGLLSLNTSAKSADNIIEEDVLNLFFQQANDFLMQKVDRDGLVDYAEIAKNPESLNGLIEKIGIIDLKESSSIEKQAFYINAYNLLVIDKLVKSGIPNSPLDDKEFFNREDIVVGKEKMSLDELEKDVLFGLEKDPRFHFALVCGAKGCPPLKTQAYTPKNLKRLLNDGAVWAANYPKFTRIDRVVKKLYLSQIFVWYAEDFTSESSTLIDYINQYLPKSISEDFEIEFYDYDWSINKQ